MSIADQITRLNNAKTAIKQSLTNKGVEVSDSALLDEYPALIDSIEVGSGEGGNPAYEAYWNLKTSNNTKYNGLFSGYTGTELDVSELDTSNVTTMCDMFYECNKLTTLDVSNFNTNKVNDMQNMFYECNKLSSLDLSNFNTNNVTNMVEMFYNCRSLTSLDVSNWDTSNVQHMGGTFRNCNQLSSLSLSNFSTGNVTDMYAMFADCISLYELDIRNFDMSNVYSTDDMFANCDHLRELHLDNCSRDTIEKIINSVGFPIGYIGVTRTIYCKGENLVTALEAPANWEFHYVDSIIPEGPEVPVDPPVEEIPLYVPGEFQENTEITEVRTMVDESHDDLNNMFAYCTNLVSVNTEDWDTSNVGNMTMMFQGCTSLTQLDVSNWDVSNVSDMFSMFQECTSLTQLNLSNFYTNNLTTMSSMFDGCTSLTTLDLSNWDTTFAYMPDWDMRDMFLNCTALHTLRLDNCNNDTIKKIIKTIGFPTNAISGVTRTIYCKEENATGLKAPTNWVFSYVD